MASLLLTVTAVTLALAPTLACLDPVLVNTLDLPENHPPVLDEVTPVPTFERLQVVVGENCVPQSFAGQLLDLDDDPLTVRFNLLVQNSASADGTRVRVREEELTPLEGRGPDGEQYSFRPLDLSFANLVSIFDVSGLLNENEKEGQLLELRVSDRGFLAGQETAAAGAGVAFFSWAIKLNFIEEGCDVSQ